MPSPEIIGRYALYGKIASGGMATVHIGRLLGPVGFSRTVAVKRMHPQFTGDPEFVAMFLDEARLAARIRHPNVVSTLDVVATNGELFLVLDYVQGDTLAALRRRAAARGSRVPVPIAAAIMSGVLHGLHAAHEAKNERGEPLGIVHRDISPQNVMVGVDGVSRVLDFGVAKAAGRLQTTESGKLKGKLAYMPPEQVRGTEVTRRCDIYAAAVVLWETLAGKRLFHADNEGSTVDRVLSMEVLPPSVYQPDIPPELDAVVLKGLARDPEDRFATARDMATALEHAVHVAIAPAVGHWVDETAAQEISAQADRIAAIESESDSQSGASSVDAQAFVELASSSNAQIKVPKEVPLLVGGTPADTSASRASALTLTAAPSPGAAARRNLLVAAATTVVAVGVTVFAMQRRDPAPSPAVSAAPVTTDHPEAPRPMPPPTGSPAAAALPSAVTPPPTPSASATPSAPSPVAAVDPPATAGAPPRVQAGAPPGAKPKRPAKPPAGPSTPAPTATANPSYNPLDNL